MKEQVEVLLTDTVRAITAVKHLEPRRAVGTLLFAAAGLANSIGITREDFLRGCQSGWDSAEETMEDYEKMVKQ